MYIICIKMLCLSIYLKSILNKMQKYYFLYLYIFYYPTEWTGLSTLFSAQLLTSSIGTIQHSRQWKSCYALGIVFHVILALILWYVVLCTWHRITPYPGTDSKVRSVMHLASYNTLSWH